jgi:5-methylcytosine-specific restriction protein A
VEQLILDVFDNFFSTRIRLVGKATLVNSPDQKAILVEIPKLIETWLAKHGLAHLFKVKGSIGNGNIARIPWVGVFRKDITENAENGYYIVLLFSENMGSCFLSLNQGITAVERLYTKAFAARKMREAAARAISYLDINPEAYIGPIDLASTGDLGRAYEAASIVSFKYTIDTLPDQRTFLKDFQYLLNCYETLYKKFGKSLNSLITVTEGEFQQVVLEKAAAEAAGEVKKNLGFIAGEVLSSAIEGTEYARSPIVSAQAIQDADFLCEIDNNHWTFTSRAKKQRYVEAHHLVPMCQQHKFLVSLDVVENIVSLCATCHRLLHFGIEKEKKEILISLFERRRKNLLGKNIEVERKDFLQFYASGALIES